MMRRRLRLRPPKDAVAQWMRRRPLALAALCWLAGIALAMGNRAPWWAYGIPAALSLGAAAVTRRPGWLPGALMALAATATSLALAMPAAPMADGARVTGRVASQPYDRGDRVSFRLAGATVDGVASPDLMAYVYKNGVEPPPLPYGTEVALVGDTWLPRPAGHAGAFDGALYYARLRLGGGLTASARTTEVIGRAPPSLIGWSLTAGERLAGVVASLYPRQGPLMTALLLGRRIDVEDSLLDAFRTSGLLHMLSLSGLHLTLLAALAQGLLRMARFPIRAAYLLTSAALTLYGLLVGFPVALVRALVMYMTLSGGRAFGLPADPPTGLAAAFLALTIVTPLNAMDAGFMLSFSSMAGMVLLLPTLGLPISNRLDRHDRTAAGRLRRAAAYVPDAVGASLCAQLGSLPAMVNLYRAVPTYGLAANALAAPLIAVALPAGMASLLLGTIWLPLGRPPAWLAEALLAAVAAVARWTAALPRALIALPDWPAWLAACYAGLLYLISPLSRLKRRVRPALLAALPAAAAVAWALTLGNVDGRLELAFLSVGQADAAVVRSGDAVALVDVGGNADAADYLAGRGLRAQAIFLTHPHDDHVGGLDEVVASQTPGVLYLPWCWDRMDADPSVAGAIDDARRAGWQVAYLHRGDRVAVGDAYAEVVHPADDYPPGDANAASMVLALRLGDGAALMTADLPAADEVAAFPDCDVLKVAHHGADASTGYRLLALSTPSVAVISVGPNSYGHPGDGAIARLEAAGARVFRTDECGTVTVSLYQNGEAEVSCFRGGEEGP